MFALGYEGEVSARLKGRLAGRSQASLAESLEAGQDGVRNLSCGFRELS
jgi:hypothetical protein